MTVDFEMKVRGKRQLKSEDWEYDSVAISYFMNDRVKRHGRKKDRKEIPKHKGADEAAFYVELVALGADLRR